MLAKRIEIIASSELLVCTAVADVPTAFRPYLSKSCAIMFIYYKAIDIATTNPADTPPVTVNAPLLASVASPDTATS